VGISFHVALLAVLSLISLVTWILLFTKKKYVAVLIVSILLAIFGLPLIIEFKSVLDYGPNVPEKLPFLLVLIILGGGDVALAGFGIIFCAMVMSKNQGNG